MAEHKPQRPGDTVMLAQVVNLHYIAPKQREYNGKDKDRPQGEMINIKESGNPDYALPKSDNRDQFKPLCQMRKTDNAVIKIPAQEERQKSSKQNGRHIDSKNDGTGSKN